MPRTASRSPPGIGRSLASNAGKLAQFPSTASVLLRRGAPPQEGDVLVNADLARSLQLVATGGADEFYRGDLARRMVQGLEAGGGLFTMADFAGHQAEVYEPITTTYRGHTVYQTRPPSQGFLLLEMLNLVEGFHLTPLGQNSAEAIHLMVEAKKIAYADRNRVAGDPRCIDWPLDELIAKAYADERRSDIHRDRVNVGLAGLQPGRGGWRYDVFLCRRRRRQLCIVDSQPVQRLWFRLHRRRYWCLVQQPGRARF